LTKRKNKDTILSERSAKKLVIFYKLFISL